MTDPSIMPAVTDEALRQVAQLLAQYQEWLRVELGFHGEEEEAVPDLPGRYAPPGGTILLARGDGGAAIGCVALRPLDEPGACEMKHLYVRPEARSTGLGRRLAQAVIASAATLGYRRIRLDTLAPMKVAQSMYRSLGFTESKAYYSDPPSGMLFMVRRL